MKYIFHSKFFKQVVRFVTVSGSGWIIDFSLFFILTSYFGLRVSYANMISSIPAITLVFLVSTSKIFARKTDGLPLPGKYAVYFLYQMILVFCISWAGDWLFTLISATGLMKYHLIADHLKLICKVLITPITMTVNFFVMKFLCEKL